MRFTAERVFLFRKPKLFEISSDEQGKEKSMKNKISMFCFLLAGWIAFSGGLTAQEKITVRKMGDKFVVRSEFSPKEDLVILNFRYANEAAYLVPKSLPLKDYQKGKRIHSNGDEYPATYFSGTILSGNHGSAFCRTLLIPNHGLTVADLGGKVTEKNGCPYVIMQIIDKDNILIHSWSDTKDSIFLPNLKKHSSAPLFYKGKELLFEKSSFTMMGPLNRITDYRLLADGKTPIPENTDVKCDYLDFIFVHDVISPTEAVRQVVENPGKKTSPEWDRQSRMFLVNTSKLRNEYPEYMKLAAVATYHNLFRFEARGANVLYRKVVYHTHIKSVRELQIMYGWCGAIAQKQKQYFYIPKMKPVKMNGLKKNDPVLEADFTANYLMPDQMNVRQMFTRADCLNPEDVPDRFIRVVGNDEPDLGIALGYSLINGSTAKVHKGADRDPFYFFWCTKKMYPYAYTIQDVQPGTTKETVCYKQYFNPKLEPDATSFFWHREGKSWLVYLDFHKELKNKRIRLPQNFVGRKITVVEKTPSLALHTENTVPAEGIRLDVTGKHGYLVLKLD